VLADGGAPATCLDLLLRSFPVIVADLSARLDELTRSVIAHADRVLFVTEPDVVSLWSAATVRQYLDATARLRFELVVNRCGKSPALDLPGLEELTRTPVRWQLPYDRAAALRAVERGEPVSLRPDSELARSFQALGRALAGQAEAKKPRGWRPFFRVREVRG
jgi:Flp pilus assembly CpaE family ATPase